MPSFATSHRTIVDPVAGEEANAVRARVAATFPSRISPLFHNSNFLKQNTLPGRKIKDSLAHAAKTFDDAILMKTGISHLQRDIVALEREAEKSKRPSTTTTSNPNYKNSHNVGPSNPSSLAALHSLPIEDLRTALSLCSYVADDASGNVVRISALTDLLLKSVNAWAGCQVENLMRIKSIYLNDSCRDGQAEVVFGTGMQAASPGNKNTLQLQRQQLMLSLDPAFDSAAAATSKIDHVLELSRLLAGNTPDATAALLRAVKDAEDFAEDQANEEARLKWGRLHQNKNVNKTSSASSPLQSTDPNNNNNNNTNTNTSHFLSTSPSPSPARSVVSNANFSISRRQQQHQLELKQQRLDHEKQLEISDALANREREKLSSLKDVGTQTADDDELLPLAPAARSLIKQQSASSGNDKNSISNNMNNKNKISDNNSSNSAARNRFAVSLATRVALDEAYLRLAELERKLFFYKSLESLVAESDLVGTVTKLCFENDKLADLGLDLPNLVIASSSCPSSGRIVSSEQQNLIKATFANFLNNNNNNTNNLTNSSNSNNNNNNNISCNSLDDGSDQQFLMGSALRSSSPNRVIKDNNNNSSSNIVAAVSPSASNFASASASQPHQLQASTAPPLTTTTKKLTAKEAALLLHQHQQQQQAAASMASMVSVKEYDQVQDECRRLRALLAVQQATLNVVVNELEISDAYRDWVDWRKCNTNQPQQQQGSGNNSVQSRLQSLRVDIPILTDDELQELIRDEEAFQNFTLQQLQLQAQQQAQQHLQQHHHQRDGRSSTTSHPACDIETKSSTSQQNLQPAAAANSSLLSHLKSSSKSNSTATPTAGNNSNAAKDNSNNAMTSNIVTDAHQSATVIFDEQQQQQHQQQQCGTSSAMVFLSPSALASCDGENNNNNNSNNNHNNNNNSIAQQIRQQVVEKKLQLASNIALRRALRENKSLHDSLTKILYRVELLESRKNSL